MNHNEKNTLDKCIEAAEILNYLQRHKKIQSNLDTCQEMYYRYTSDYELQDCVCKLGEGMEMEVYSNADTRKLGDSVGIITYSPTSGERFLGYSMTDFNLKMDIFNQEQKNQDRRHETRILTQQNVTNLGSLLIIVLFSKMYYDEENQEFLTSYQANRWRGEVEKILNEMPVISEDDVYIKSDRTTGNLESIEKAYRILSPNMDGNEPVKGTKEYAYKKACDLLIESEIIMMCDTQKSFWERRISFTELGKVKFKHALQKEIVQKKIDFIKNTQNKEGIA